MSHHRAISAILFALLASVGPVRADGAPPATVAFGRQAPPSSVEARVARTPLEKADALIKALTRRGLALAQRRPATRPAAPAPRSRLASRAAGTSRSVTSAAPATNLVEYLGILDRVTPGGLITGRFNDWRSPSMYRAVGGRHNGYDVALPRGSRIVVGWPGRVSAITNWYGSEYGITVVSPEGFHTIYGHLAPSVRIGQWLEPGDAVGTIVRDHVDIKMKDAGGHSIDFAQRVPFVRTPIVKAEASALVAGDSSVFPPLGGPDWTLRHEAVKTALEYVRLRYQEAALVAAGGTASVPMLAQVRHDLDDARHRLAVEEVPEEVLLAAFVGTPSLQESAAVGGGVAQEGPNALAEWLRSRQLVASARSSVSQLDQLIVDLRD